MGTFSKSAFIMPSGHPGHRVPCHADAGTRQPGLKAAGRTFSVYRRHRSFETCISGNSFRTGSFEPAYKHLHGSSGLFCPPSDVWSMETLSGNMGKEEIKLPPCSIVFHCGAAIFTDERCVLYFSLRSLPVHLLTLSYILPAL